MNHEAAVSNAKDIADRVLAPAARQKDKEGRFFVGGDKGFRFWGSCCRPT
jgi:hypothetical protein